MFHRGDQDQDSHSSSNSFSVVFIVVTEADKVSLGVVAVCSIDGILSLVEEVGRSLSSNSRSQLSAETRREHFS